MTVTAADPVREADQHFEPLLKRMSDLYPAYLRGDQWKIREGSRESAHLAHGWYQRCQRGLEAVVRLDELGYAEEAAPIRRSVIEHGVALRWVAAEGDKILGTVASGHAMDSKRLGAEVEAAAWTSVDLEEIARAAASAEAAVDDRSHDYLLHFAHRAKEYADVHTMVEYRAESARSHACYESAMCYCHPPDGLLDVSRDMVWQIPFATTHLLEALLAVRQVFDPMPWEQELGEIVAEWQEVVNRGKAARGLAPVDWERGVVMTDGPS